MNGKRRGSGLTVREMAIYAVLGSLAFASRVAMSALPNIHLLGMFTMLFALAFGRRGLIPLYLSVFLSGFVYGFDVWWLAHMILWPLLFGVTRLLPKNMSRRTAAWVYMLICGLFGLAFGTLCAPFQAIQFGLDLRGALAWIAVGFPYDCLHAAGNVAAAALILPLLEIIRKLEKRPY